jgi:hypothetical protein
MFAAGTLTKHLPVSPALRKLRENRSLNSSTTPTEVILQPADGAYRTEKRLAHRFVYEFNLSPNGEPLVTNTRSEFFKLAANLLYWNALNVRLSTFITRNRSDIQQRYVCK